MNRSSDSRSGPSILELVPRLAVALAGLAAVASLAAGQEDPAAAAETAYLALAAGIPLIAAAAVGPGPAVPALGSAAVVALVWLVPFGPVRGSLVGSAATASLLLAALGRVGAIGRRGRGDGLRRLLRPVPALGLALGLQALLRADELLAPPSAVWALVVYAALPVVGGLAVLTLARLEGPAVGALAGAAALVVGPGFRPATVIALVALPAASLLLGRRRLPLPRGARIAVRLAAGFLLAAPAVWSLQGAAVAALAGGVLALRRRPLAPAALGVAGVAGALSVALAPPDVWGPLGILVAGTAHSPGTALRLTALVPTLVPALAWPPAGATGERAGERIPRWLGPAAATLGLAFAAALAVPVEGALAAPAALAAALVGARTRPEVEPRDAPPGLARALQGGWSAILLAGAAVAGSYPWLRTDPADTVLGALGVPPGWPGAGTTVLCLVLLAGLGRAHQELARPGRAAGSWSRPAAQAPARFAVGLLLAVVLSLALLRLPAPGAIVVERGTPLRLDESLRSWTAGLEPGPGESEDGRPVGSIVLETALANAADLPAGTPVATVSLRGLDRPARTWSLRVAKETGEWAAGRPELAAPEIAPAPPAWLSWVSPADPFYGHTYRTVLAETAARSDGHRPGDEPLRADRLELRLRPDLPQQVVLTVFHLELRP